MPLFAKSLANKRSLTVIVAAALLPLIIVLFVYQTRLWSLDRQVSLPEPAPEIPKYDGPEFQFHGINHLQQTINISTIRLLAEAKQRLPALKESLQITLPTFQQLNLEQPYSVVSRTDAKVVVQIPQDEVLTDASHLTFGVATTLIRLRDAVKAFSHWASNTGANFIIIVEPPNPELDLDEPSVAEMIELYKINNISISVFESSEHYLDRYVSLLSVIHDNLKQGTKWVSIIDDDTFFPSMDRLLAMLAKHDASQPFYIGGISEDKWANENYGLMAFGGAGIFLSVPLIQELRPYADECLCLPAQSGDHRIAMCIYEFSTTKLTWEHGLYQLDLHADATGFYEAVRPLPISVHHWKSAHNHDMVLISAVSKICGASCVFQKYEFLDSEGQNWHMTNGFSIVKYNYTKDEEEMFSHGAMEKTWTEAMWTVVPYVLGPFKPRDEGKVQYMLEAVVEDEPDEEVANQHSEREGAKSMTLYYVKRINEVGDSIIRVIWQRV